MTTVPGQLRLDDKQHVRALAEHLRRREGIVVRVLNADGEIVFDGGEVADSCPPNDRSCREFLRESCAACAQKESSACLTCPKGRQVQVLPITRSSIFFGSIVACTPAGHADAGHRSTGAVLDAMLNVLAEESSKAQEIESLAVELALRYEELDLLYEIDEKIPLRSYTSHVVEYVAEKVFNVIRCSCLAWVPFGAATGPGAQCRLFWPRAVGGGSDAPTSEEPSMMLRLEAEQLARALAERSSRSGQPIVITNLDEDHELSAFASELHSVLCLPLCVEGDLYGCLVAFRPRGDQFTSYELKLMSALARKSAFVMRDSRLYEDLDSLFFNLIKLLVNTIENKDEYTKGHSQRVRTFTVRLATLMQLPAKEIETLNLSGLLHDVGKQGIPDAVLKKEGKLTDEERALINTHPIRGVNLIRHIKQFERCLPHIRHHHERIDGKGYPDGLKGDEIPLGARIIAVADTYDALTSDRCYRPRFDPDKAFEIIREVSGTQLDAKIAGLLLSNRAEFARQSQSGAADHLVINTNLNGSPK